MKGAITDDRTLRRGSNDDVRIEMEHRLAQSGLVSWIGRYQAMIEHLPSQDLPKGENPLTLSVSWLQWPKGHVNIADEK